MASLLNLLDVSLHFGGPAILEKINFQIDPGERVCLLGRNGAGKSTLMKVVVGEMKPDTGDVFRPANAVYRRLNQEVPSDLAGTVHDIVYGGLRPNGDHHEEEWERDVRVEDLINAIRLPPTQEFSALSGGLKRRALLARGSATSPKHSKKVSIGRLPTRRRPLQNPVRTKTSTPAPYAIPLPMDGGGRTTAHAPRSG